MNSKDGIERINILQEDEKDYQQWKDKPIYPWQKYNKEHAGKYKEEQERIKGLKYINTCPQCETVENTDNEISPWSEQNTSYLCYKCGEEKEEKERIESERVIAETKKRKMDKRCIDFLLKVPPRFTTYTLKECNNEDLINSDCCIIYGGFGTGKTWEAYSLAKKLYCNLYIEDFKIITEVGLINNIKAGFSDNSFEKRLESIKEVDLLIVDEMGKMNDSEFNKAQMFEILNYRYDWMKKTVLICNAEKKEELYDILNPAVLDRYREMTIHLDGKSKRYVKK